MTSVMICTSRGSWKHGSRVVRREFFEVVFYSLSTWPPLVPPSLCPISLISPGFDPSFPCVDDDTAQYLSEALAASSQDPGRGWSATDVKNALEETRTKKETTELEFEDRVSAVLSILGVS